MTNTENSKRSFSWKNEPSNSYWNTTIYVETDYDTTEDAVRKFLDSLDWFDYKWAKNHRDEFPLRITIKGNELELKHRTGSDRTTVSRIEQRTQNLYDMMKAASR